MNMFGALIIALPIWGIYFSILKLIEVINKNK